MLALLLAIALPVTATASAATASAAAAPAPGSEQSIVKSMRESFGRTGKPVPALDPRLSAAARSLAARSLAGAARDATGGEAVAQALSQAGAWDPGPHVIAVKVSPAAQVAASLARRDDLTSERATHFGVGVMQQNDQAVAVVLLTERRAGLEPFPRSLQPGATASLRGQLSFPLHDARIFITSPGGEVRTIEPARETRDRFAADIPFTAAGQWTVEVIGQSVKGPEVVALFRVDAGTPRVSSAAQVQPSPKPESRDSGRAESQVLAAIQQRRQRHGLGPLSRSALLDSVAAAHAAEMARLGYFGHVSPLSGDVARRAAAAGFRYARITENLGEAATALEAHQAIEASPGHLGNVLDAKVELVGLGTARVRRGAIENLLLVEVFAREGQAAAPPVTGPDGLAALLNAARVKNRLKPLLPDETLDGLARAHLRRMLTLGAPTAGDLADKVLQGSEYESVAVDVLVADSADAALKSKNLLRGQFGRLGLGMAPGPPEADGRRQLWVVVVYARAADG